MSWTASHLARILALAALAVPAAAAPARAQRPAPLQPDLIRVCADPDNMPSSNDKSEGYENKIATLIAKDLNAKLTYVWYPTRRGYFRILNGRYCDLAIEAPVGLDFAGATKPYFRSGYYFVAREGSGLENVNSLSDPRLKKLRIGVNVYTSDAENSPPAMALSYHGVVGNLKGFSTFYDDQNRPEDIIEAVERKEVDIAIAWGPVAGYFAEKSTVPLVLTPLPVRDSLSDLPFQYDIAIAVRRADKEFRDSLQAVLERRAPEIQAILKEYHVPLLPMEEGREKAARSSAAPAIDSTRRPGPG